MAQTRAALYHHFPTKAAVFEAVFEQVHAEMLAASAAAAAAADGAVAQMTAGFGVFLDQVLEPEVQRIIITDGPAVLGLARFVELDERYAVDAAVAVLEAANASGALAIDDPQTRAGCAQGSVPEASTTARSEELNCWAQTRSAWRCTSRTGICGRFSWLRPCRR